MLDRFSSNPVFPLGQISSWGKWGVAYYDGRVTQSHGAAAWPTANKAIYMHLVIPVDIVFDRFYVINPATIAGNVDVGIYNSKTKALIRSTGSTARAGATSIQSISVSPVHLQPGSYLMALASDTATGSQYQRGANTSTPHLTWEEAAAFPLPATATPVASVGNFQPYFGIFTVGTY